MPARFAALGDPHAQMDSAPGSLDDCSSSRRRTRPRGLGDAPWPPHFRKMDGEAPRVAPSRAKAAAKKTAAESAAHEDAAHRRRELAEQARLRWRGFERWKNRHAEIGGLLAEDDVLVDSMRGRSSTWTRIRVNLRHVPESRSTAPQEPPDPDDDPTREWRDLHARRLQITQVSHAQPACGENLPRARAAGRPRAARRCNRAVVLSGRQRRNCAVCRNAGPACDRRPPRRRAPAAAAPTRGPCPGSSGSWPPGMRAALARRWRRPAHCFHG